MGLEDTHQLGVVGIFFDVVENMTNPAFEAMFGHHDEHLENIRWPGKSDHTEIITGLDLAELIPSDIGSRGYYAYEGSLTTPPCTNIVRWHVMNARQTIGVNQIAQFRALMMDNSNKTLAPNYREIMPTFNEVYACGDWDTEDSAVEEEKEKTKLSAGWIVAIVALILAAVFLLCFIMKSFKVQALEQEIKDVAQMNRLRVNSEKKQEECDAVTGVQSKGTMEMGDMQKV